MEPRGLPRLLMHLANGLVILFIMLPIVAVVLGSLQPERTLQGESRRVIPSEWTLDNFTVILTQGQQKGRIFEQATYLPDNIKSFYRAFANSLIVALGVTLLTVGFGALSAYTVARLKLRWALWLMQANVVARFLPAIVLMIPLYVVVRSLGQLNTLHAVVLTETGFLLPYAIVILVPFFANIPADLEDAARIDGCTHFQAFWRIILPLSAPGLAACAVIMFIISWHELLIPLILNSRPEFMTLPAALRPAMDDLVAHSLENRAGALQVACLRSHHEQTFSALSVGGRTADGGINKTNASLGEQGAEGAACRRIDGAHVDHQHSGAAGLEKPPWPADHAGDIGGVRQHGDDDIGGGDERPKIAGVSGSSINQHVSLNCGIECR